MAGSLVSILITTHNRSRAISEVLGRLSAIFPHEESEILVFNDASSDDTAAVCTRYGTRIRYYEAPTSVGYIEGRRRLMTLAQGDYLAVLDDDSCFLDREALALVRDVFARHATCAIIAANIASPAEPAGQMPTDRSPMHAGGFVGCGHVVRAQALHDVGGYADFLSGYGAEETYLSLRLLSAGWDILLVPALRVFHAQSPTQRPTEARRGTSLANEIGIVLNAYPGWLVPAVAGAKLLKHLAFSLRHHSVHAMAHAALRALPHTLRLALRDRHAVRMAAILQMRKRRESVFRARFAYFACAGDSSAWPEITHMFVDH